MSVEGAVWSIAGAGITISALRMGAGKLSELQVAKDPNMSAAQQGRASQVQNLAKEIQKVQITETAVMQWAQRHNLQLVPLSDNYNEIVRLGASEQAFATLQTKPRYT